MSHYIYILECADSTFYIGCTNNIEKRLHQHNNSKRGAKYTKTRRPVVVRYTEECNDLGTALKREYELKQLSREQKLRLIESGTHK